MLLPLFAKRVSSTRVDLSGELNKSALPSPNLKALANRAREFRDSLRLGLRGKIKVHFVATANSPDEVIMLTEKH